MATMLGSLLVSLGLESAQFKRDLRTSKQEVDGFSKFAGKAMLALGSAVAGATAAMGLLVRNSINVADEISKAAQKVGIGTEELSRLRYAADLSGVSFQQLQTGVQRLNRNMVALGGESKAFTATVQRLGISTRDANGNLLSSTQVMAQVADRFAGMQDGAEKSALAMQLFGKSGAELIPLLNGGSAALEQMTNEADRFGIVIDERTGKRAEAFNDNVTRLKGAFEAAATAIAAELLPVMVDLTDALVEAAGGMRDLARESVQTLQRVGDLGRGIRQLATDMLGLQGNTGLAERTMENFRSVMARVAPQIRVVIDQLERVGRSARRLDEVGLGAGGSMKSLSDIIADSGVQMKTAAAAGDGAAAAIGRVGGAARAAARGGMKDMRDELTDLIERYFPELVSRAQAASLALVRAAQDAGRISQEMGTTLRLRILGVTPGEISDSLKSVMKDAGDGSLEGMKLQILDFAKKTKDANQQVADSFGTMADRALQALDRLAQGIQRGDFLSILSGVLGIGLQLGGLGLFGKGVAANINSQGGRIPGFANGTRYAPGGLAMVGERGRELVNLPRGSQVIPNRDLSGMMGPTRIVVGVDPKNGSIQPYVDNQIVQAAPAIMQGGASLAGQQMSRQARRRT